MPFRVQFERKAEFDLRRAEQFLVRLGPKSLSHWHTRLQRAIRGLREDPGRYPEADEAGNLNVDLREMLFGRRPHIYRVLFSIKVDTITIHRIRHAARDRIDEDDL
jgi:toxin ParE1/3/4